MKQSRIERVHQEFADELNKMWEKCNREVSKVNLTKKIAGQIRENNRQNPRYIVNYWPLSKRKVKVY